MNEVRKIGILVFVLVGMISCSSNSNEPEVKPVNIKSKSVNNVEVHLDQEAYTLEATFSPEFGWGYQILNNGELYINQPHIPSVQGNKGFDSKDKAIKTAEYIINKLEHDIFPPTVSPEELDSLDVL